MSAITNEKTVLPIEFSRGVITGIIGRSKALELGRELPRMSTKVLKLNVLSQLPATGWVGKSATPTDGNTPNGYPKEIRNKPLSVLAWEGKDITAEALAVIVPVSIDTINDVKNYVDIASLLREQVIGAFQEKLDATLLFGTDSPWTDFSGVVPGAIAAGAYVNWDGSAGVSFYNAISKAMEFVETSGYIPDAILGGPSLNSALRGAITPLGINVAEQGQVGNLYKHICLTGGFDDTSAFAIVGDFKRGLVYAFREDLEMRLLEEATIYDPATGEKLYSLAQQDMVAFRFVLRIGAQVPNPVNRVNSTEKRYPFAIITKGEASGQ